MQAAIPPAGRPQRQPQPNLLQVAAVTAGQRPHTGAPLLLPGVQRQQGRHHPRQALVRQKRRPSTAQIRSGLLQP